MAFLKEFKEFAMRGNVIDLAVGIVIGAAFTKIVNSLVSGVFTPITAYLTGNTDVSDMTYPLSPIVEGQKTAEIGWGSVVQATVEFLIVAFALFLVVKVMNRLKRQEPPPPAAPTEEVLLLRDLRALCGCSLCAHPPNALQSAFNAHFPNFFATVLKSGPLDAQAKNAKMSRLRGSRTVERGAI